MTNDDEREMTEFRSERSCLSMKVTPPGPVMALVWTLLVVSGWVAIPAAVGVISGGLHLLPWCVPFALMLFVYRQVIARGELGSGRARLEGGALLLEGKTRRRRVALDDVSGGSHSGATLNLQLRRGAKVELKLQSESDAVWLIDQTGTGVASRTLTLQLRGAVGPFVAGLLFFFGAYAPIFFAVVAVLTQIARLLGWDASAPGPAPVLVSGALSLVLAWWLARVRAPRVTIGQDGVVVERWMRRRFIPHAHIQSVRRTASSLELELDDQRVQLSTIGWSEEQELGALQRLHDARARFEQAREASPERDAVFARRGESAAKWRERLLSAGFRKRVVTDDDAASVLEDPTQPLEHRAGAAIALKALDPTEGARRIRLAAEVAAEPRARELLLGMLEDDEHVDETLRRLEAERE